MTDFAFRAGMKGQAEYEQYYRNMGRLPPSEDLSTLRPMSKEQSLKSMPKSFHIPEGSTNDDIRKLQEDHDAK